MYIARAEPLTQNQLTAHFQYLHDSSQKQIEKFTVFSFLVSPEEDPANRCVTRKNNTLSVIIQRLHLYCFPTSFPKAAVVMDWLQFWQPVLAQNWKVFGDIFEVSHMHS